MIGESGAGKSCLVNSLFGKPNDKEHKSTNAVEKFECRKFHASSSEGKFLKERDIKEMRNETERRVAEDMHKKSAESNELNDPLDSENGRADTMNKRKLRGEVHQAQTR